MTAFTQTLADEICSRIASGESLRAICTSEGMPSKTSVFRWLASNEKFRDQYAHAKEAGCEALAEELFDIADDGTNDWVQSNDPDNPGYRLNGEHVQRSKLRVDTRKWYLSKIVPKKYGENSKVELAGSIDLRKMSDDEIDEELAQLAAVVAVAAPQDGAIDDGSDLI